MADLCTMCEQRPATKEFAFPVCDECHAWLTKLDGKLKEMEADDPELARLGQKVKEAARGVAPCAQPGCYIGVPHFHDSVVS